jgi:hypothetical protein
MLVPDEVARRFVNRPQFAGANEAASRVAGIRCVRGVGAGLEEPAAGGDVMGTEVPVTCGGVARMSETGSDAVGDGDSRAVAGNGVTRTAATDSGDCVDEGAPTVKLIGHWV